MLYTNVHNRQVQYRTQMFALQEIVVIMENNFMPNYIKYLNYLI